MDLFQKLVRDYEGRVLQDDGAYCSKDFNTFARKCKNAIKKFCEEEGIELESFHVGHYEFSGFLTKAGKYVYFAYDIRRGLPLDFDRDDALCGVLVREADGPKDYIGHANHFCAFRNLVPYIKTFFEKILN